MFRACLLCALLLVGLLSVGITAQPAGGPPLRLEQLEDGDQSISVPLLGAPGWLILLGSLLAGAFLRFHAAHARS